MFLIVQFLNFISFPEILCLSLDEPENGIIMYNIDVLVPFDLGTTATYVCNIGFGLSGGVGVRTCIGNGKSSVGEWTESAPNCLRKSISSRILKNNIINNYDNYDSFLS